MAIKKRPVSPRQKMINLMYVVLMAMLALNVSTEVLNGFSIVEESLNRTTASSTKENRVIYDDFEAQMKANPAKVKAWFDKAQEVKRMSDSLYNFAGELKLAIVREADGKKADVTDIVNKEDLEAATQVMLAPGRGRGEALYKAINSFRERILTMVPDSTRRAIIADNLSTRIPRNAVAMGKNWQEYMFEGMPVAAAVTLLSKLQSDIRYAEGEVLHTLVANIDVKDIRVNALNAFVIPNSQTIVRGDKFSAHIVMAAVDTTQVPDIYIGERKVNLTNGLYETICGSTGDFTLAGHIEMVNGGGERIRRDFSQKYTVVDPSATVSADLMNVLYAGYSNPISVSVPGVPLNKVQAVMTGGALQPVGPGRYIARPAAVGKDVTITLAAEAGQLPAPQELAQSGQLANFSFGQGSLLATPMQVAALFNTIAADGVYRSPYVLQATLDETTGQPVETLSHPRGRRVISAQNAALLRAMLVQVVQQGTAQDAAGLSGGAGGKTGTAQTGQFTPEGTERCNLWFAGFWPAEKPRYTIVVLQDGAVHTAYSGAAIFAQVCNVLEAAG